MTHDELARIKRTPIDHVVGLSGLTVVGTGKVKSTREHDSLRLFMPTNSWFWYQPGVGGDVIRWVEYTQHVTFPEACQLLAQGELSAVPYKPVAPPPTPDPLPADLHLQLHARMTADQRAWWLGRGISEAAMSHFQLGAYRHRSWGLCYTIPILEQEALVNIRLRIAEPPHPKDKYRPFDVGRGTHIFNGDILTPDLTEVVIVAGELKVVALWDAGIPAISPTAGCSHWRPEWTARLAHCRRIWIAFDPGEEPAAEHLAETIGERARLMILPAKPDDFLFQEGLSAFRFHMRRALPLAAWRKAEKVAIPPALAAAFYDATPYEPPASAANVPWRRHLWRYNHDLSSPPTEAA